MNRTNVLAIVLIGTLWASICAVADDKRPMTIDDGLNLKRIDEAIISPDGNSVIYSVSKLDWEENKYTNEHFLYRESSRDTRNFIGEEGGEDFQFSPDGEHVAFLRDPDSNDDEEREGQPGKSQIYVIPVDGGEAMPATDHRGGVRSFKWMPDGSGLIFLADDMETEAIEKERELGDDSYFVDLAPNGKHMSRYSNFWSIELANEEEHQLSSMQLVARDFDISPDQSRVVFVARPDTRTNHPGDAEIYLLSLEDKSIARLTDNDAPESSVMWSPDGNYIAYRAPDDRTHQLRSGYFWILDPDTREVRRLDGQSTGELSTEASWSADSRYIIYNEIHGTNTNLFRINVRNGEAQALTTITGNLRAHGFSSDTERMVYSRQNFTTPPDLYIGDLRTRRATQITDLNPWVKESLTLSGGELLTWSSKGEMQIEGVYYPAIGNNANKSPLIVHIHGGPAGVIENAFREDFQILAGQGYAIFAPNFRGSTGYGDELLRGLIGEVGDGEFQDVMTGVDLVIAEKSVDPDRMGVRGWSWGGVSTSYVITQTDRFKAASIGAMVGNWAAETGPGFNFDVSLWYIGGMPWENPEEWRKRSSISHVKNVSTPSIIFHGGNDETSSVGQSLMFYTALREIGEVPVKYMKFPREGHGIREPRHRRRLEGEEITWFKKYIDGEEWSLGPRM